MLDQVGKSIKQQMLEMCNRPSEGEQIINAILHTTIRSKHTFLMLDNQGCIGSYINIVFEYADINIDQYIHLKASSCQKLGMTKVSHDTLILKNIMKNWSIGFIVSITFINPNKLTLHQYMKASNYAVAYNLPNEYFIDKKIIIKRNGGIHEELMKKMYHPDLIAEWLSHGHTLESFRS